jgi:hypothetical protein
MVSVVTFSGIYVNQMWLSSIMDVVEHGAVAKTNLCGCRGNDQRDAVPMVTRYKYHTSGVVVMIAYCGCQSKETWLTWQPGVMTNGQGNLVWLS